MKIKKRTGLPDTGPGIPQEVLQQPTTHQACQSTPVAQEKMNYESNSV